MKITSYAVGRPTYYDRNLGHSGVSAYLTGIAPHAEVVRSTLTISASRKGFVDFGSLAMLRESAAATAGIIFSTIIVAPGGVGGQVLVLVPMYTAVLGTTVSQSVSGSMPMVASDVLTMTTRDASTGGTIHFMIYAHVTLFDA